MVRKIKKKKAETAIMDMNKLDDLRPVMNYWLNLIGEGEKTKKLFDGCRSKKDILKVFYDLILEKHSFIDKLDHLRENIAPVMEKIHRNLELEQDVMDHGQGINDALKTKTPIGYWETLKCLQWFVLTTYIDNGREDELPLYTDKESDFMPDMMIIVRG